MEQIVQRVAEGETLRAICKEPGMPSPTTFRKWLLDNKPLADKWTLAKNLRAHSLFDEAIDLAHDLKNTNWGKEDSPKVRAREIAIRTLMEAAEKLLPHEYAPKPGQQTVVPIQINTNLNLGQDGPPKKGVNPNDVYTINVTPKLIEG